MRGAANDDDVNLTTLRITPAYAGSSVAIFNTAMANQDHPRVCGEQKGGLSAWNTRVGSPPRMRGAD